MKNRITALFLAIALIVCAMPIMAAATETEAVESKKPQIISKNIEYGGNFAMMFAVDTTTVTGDVRLEMYDAGAVLVGTYTPEKTEDIKTPDNVTHNAHIFITKGVAAKDMADYYYVKAIDSEGNESDLVRYSVAEYMYERLYGGYDLTENQKALYESVIVMGSNAQKVLINDNPNLEDEVLVSEYKYVVLNGATVDGYDTGVYAKNTILTLEGAASTWEIEYADGTTANINGTLTVTEHCTVNPYTGISTVYDFENFTLGEMSKVSGNSTSTNGVTIYKFLTEANGHSVSVVNNIQNNASNILKLEKDTSSNGGFGFAFSGEEGENIASYVFEFDMYTSSLTSIQFGFSTSSTGMQINKFDIKLSSFDEDTNTYAVEISKNAGVGTDDLLKDETLTRVNADSWVNYRLEYYASAKVILVYINGDLVGTTDCLIDKNGTAPTYATFFGTSSTAGTFYLDNVKVEKSTKTYTAPVID